MHKKVKLLFVLAPMVAFLSACQKTETAAVQTVDTAKLQQVVGARSDEMRLRDQFRNPEETLSFFQVAPGMTVAEALPGGGWYSRILSNYLGDSGTLYGLNYDDDMWARFGFFSDEFIQQRIEATGKFEGMVKEFTQGNITAKGYTFSTTPDTLNGSVDRVLFIRALHNLNRFEKDANTLSDALKTTHRILKDDGLVGVVQHNIPESAPEQGSDGSRGYMKLSTIKQAFNDAGFEFVSSSNINTNPKDQPSDSDIVWRLPPTYNGIGEDEEKRAQVDAIGESNRVTLLFKKAS